MSCKVKRKHIRFVIIFVIIIVLGMKIYFYITVSDERKSYFRYLMSFKDPMIWSVECMDASEVLFDCVDLNHDQIDELILLNPYAGRASGFYRILTYFDGKLHAEYFTDIRNIYIGEECLVDDVYFSTGSGYCNYKTIDFSTEEGTGFTISRSLPLFGGLDAIEVRRGDMIFDEAVSIEIGDGKYVALFGTEGGMRSYRDYLEFLNEKTEKCEKYEPVFYKNTLINRIRHILMKE